MHMRNHSDRSPRGERPGDGRRHHDDFGRPPFPASAPGPFPGGPPGAFRGGPRSPFEVPDGPDRGHRGHHHHPGPFGPPGDGRGRGRGRGRARRGDMRLAVLRLLAERPMHGYEIKTELAERSGGRWDPSPGSIYPTLSALADEGLVTAENDGGRRTFTLTAEGNDLAAADQSAPPWEATPESGPGDELRGSFHALRMAVEQIAEAGTPQDREHAVTLLDEARRTLYLLLAGVPAPDPRSPATPPDPS